LFLTRLDESGQAKEVYRQLARKIPAVRKARAAIARLK